MGEKRAFTKEFKERAVESFMVRYADDAIIGREKQEDADRIMKVLALRFAKYGLTIHPEKTNYERPAFTPDYKKFSEDYLKFALNSQSSKLDFLEFKPYYTKFKLHPPLSKPNFLKHAVVFLEFSLNSQSYTPYYT
jgi:hypothetical protein